MAVPTNGLRITGGEPQSQRGEETRESARVARRGGGVVCDSGRSLARYSKDADDATLGYRQKGILRQTEVLSSHFRIRMLHCGAAQWKG